MKRVNGILRMIVAVCFMWLCICMPIACKAADNTTILPGTDDNTQINLRSTSSIVAIKTGYMRVYYDGDKTIRIEYYDKNFNITKKKSIAMELEYWGGFYAGKNAYYIVEGQKNEAESLSAEVIRVIKYDTNWKRLGAAKISTSTANDDLFGSDVRYPFDYGCVEMAEHDGTLFIVTGHEGYVDETYGMGHQGYLMLTVDEASMTGKIVDSNLGHSFAQYIKADGDDMYVLQQSEGGRCTSLSRLNPDVFASGNYDWWWHSEEDKTSISVLDYGGDRVSAWAIACYASVDDLAVSEKNVLGLGTSIDQTKYDSVSETTAHNIYLTVTPKSNFTQDATTVKWLTSYSGKGKCFYGTKITKVNNNRFLVTWEEYDTSRKISGTDTLSTSILHYVFVDGNGTKISKEYTAAAPISDCHPILSGSNIVYYASNSSAVDFYTINATTGKFSKKTYQVAGENVSWSLKNGVLTIMGRGALETKKDSDEYRYPVSSTQSWYSFSDSENIWGELGSKVKKVVIKKGITSIGSNFFSRLSNLTEVNIADGVKSIGDEAFAYCSKLNKVIIPDSVTKIGTDVMWSGWYTLDYKTHITYGTIYAKSGSYAIKYAKKNNIAYELIRTSIAKAKVTGLKSKYVYNGKAKSPAVVVKVGGKTLKRNTDYKVTYKNNRKTGKASVVITGKGNYEGTIKKSFVIVPKKEKLTKLTSRKKKSVKVTWVKDKMASGYQVQCALNSKFTKGKKTAVVKTSTSKTFTKLRSRKYYVRVRSYKLVNGKKYFGAWSKVKTVRCK